jgi:hypothetical protein
MCCRHRCRRRCWSLNRLLILQKTFIIASEKCGWINLFVFSGVLLEQEIFIFVVSECLFPF